MPSAPPSPARSGRTPTDCAVCGTLFTPGRLGQIYCSSRCRRIHQVQRLPRRRCIHCRRMMDWAVRPLCSACRLEMDSAPCYGTALQAPAVPYGTLRECGERA